MLAVTVTALAAALLLRRDLTVALGDPLWLCLAGGLGTVAAWLALRIFRPVPLLQMTPDALTLPRLLAAPLPWTHIRRITTATQRGPLGDIRDRLIIHLNHPADIGWRSARMRRTMAGLPQTAIAVDIGLAWPVRADALKDIIRRTARDFAAGGEKASDAVPPAKRLSPVLGAAAMIAAALLPLAAQQADFGLPRLFSEGLKLYRAGDIAAALPLLESDARAGDPAAAHALGTLYLNGDGVERNPSMAAAWFGRAAAAGDADGAYRLGEAYRLGLGVAADIETALTWLRKAAALGSAEAAFTLARVYRLGDGVRRDYPEAVRWLREAAARDFAPAEHDLGRLYVEGLALPRDREEAKRWYLRAAGRGLIAARYDLARLYLDGPPEDRARGLRYLAEAAESGDAPAQRLLAALLVRGQGLPADPIAAYKWISLAERAWPAATRADLVREKARIAAGLNAAEIDAATAQIRTWRPLRP